MYRRFLNDSDYLGVITAEALSQMTRNSPERFIQAEESAEMSITEYLSENYEIEREFNRGKYIAEQAYKSPVREYCLWSIDILRNGLRQLVKEPLKVLVSTMA